MGLDSYWKREKKYARAPKFEKSLSLIGGLFSGHGNESFRGKCYSTFIEEITGETLYQENIPNKTIKEMSKKLNEAIYYRRFWDDSCITKKEFKDLQRMFSAYAKEGFCLRGWW